MKKIIAVTAKSVIRSGEQYPTISVDQTYADAVRVAGAVPVITGGSVDPNDYADMADGLLLTGGESVHPRYYGETFDNMADNCMETIQFLRWGCNAARDEVEMALFDAFMRRQKPIFGICRGIQLINARTGGKNELDFPRHHAVEHNTGISHKVIAEADSAVGRIMGREFISNSYHRDRLVSVGPDIRITARSEDGIIEAIEHCSLPVFGVQFHPERMRGDHPIPLYGPDATGLFRYFVSLMQ